ncbi:MAG: toprim domain-containing protein, partial [Gammaproteobacteria bacterium]|nr:toprim domain-containing protein [Gammaproteobacteria bacterium]
MARIPEAELARLKAEVSLERLVTARGIVLKRHGADLVGLCPFHDDREPSLVVSPRTNLWHCLGACQRGGSVVDWVMQAEGVSFRHAVELLREGLPSLAAEVTPRVVKQSTVPKLAAPLTEDADDAALLGQIVDYYHASLKQSPEALAYLARRGLDHPEVIKHFKLGFANRTLGLRLPSMNRKAGAELRARLQRLGILRASGHEHFNGSLVVPVLDAAGQVCELYGRKITEHLRPGTPLHLYLPGPHRGVWNVEALAASKEIILCEALLDALTFWCAGYRHVTASYGVSGFTAEHLAALQAHGTERVLIAYDRDAAGEQAAAALAVQLGAAGIACYRVQFPKGMDANAYALKVTPATKSLGLVLRQAVPLAAAPGRPVAANVPAREPSPPPVEAAATARPAFPLAAEVLPATPCPPGPPPAPAAEVQAHEVVLPLGERRYRIRGLAKNLGVELLKVNVLVSQGESFYVDTLDLYAAKQRASYVTHAALELGVPEEVLKRELGAVLRHCETLQEEALTRALAPAAPAGPTLSATEREAALEL